MPRAVMGTVAALATLLPLALAHPAAPAQAADFGEPVVVSSGRDDASLFDFALTPTGAVAAVWTSRTRVRGRPDWTFQMASGPSLDRIGRPRPATVPGAPTGETATGAEVYARPDGGILLCLQFRRVEGCSVAPPSASFGPFIPLGRPSDERDVVIRPDSTAVILRGTGRTLLGSTVDVTTTVQLMAADGALGPRRTLFVPRAGFTDAGDALEAGARPDGSVVVVRNPEGGTAREDSPDGGPPDEPSASMAIVDPAGVPGPEGVLDFPELPAYASLRPEFLRDGTVLLWTDEVIEGTTNAYPNGFRTMPPGTATFGPRVRVPGMPRESYAYLARGLRRPTIVWNEDAASVTAPSPYRFVERLPDGSFGPVLAAPTGPRGARIVRPLVPLGGAPAGLTASQQRPSTAGCVSPAAGTVGVGPLLPLAQTGTWTRLSTRGQAAFDAEGTDLGDGTLVASWLNGSTSGRPRVETAIRAPGAEAFGPPRRLARLTDGEAPNLFTAGDQAALVWMSPRGRPRDPGRPWEAKTDLVVSVLTRSGAPARQAPLPRHPGAACFGSERPLSD